MSKDTIIHKTFHENSYIEIADSEEFRSLYFGERTLQSRQFHNEPQRLALSYPQYMMLSLLLLNKPPERVLLIGLGGGSIIHFINYHFPHCLIDAVDNNPHILNIAKEFFNVQETSQTAIYCQDGFDFIKDTIAQYDLILIDAYDEHGMVPRIFNDTFSSHCESQLSKAGVISCNLWSGDSETLNMAQYDLRRNFKSNIFLPVTGRGNIVSCSSNSSAFWQKLTLSPKTKKALHDKYNIDFSHIIKIATANNLSWQQRVKLYFCGNTEKKQLTV